MPITGIAVASTLNEKIVIDSQLSNCQLVNNGHFSKLEGALVSKSATKTLAKSTKISDLFIYLLIENAIYLFIVYIYYVPKIIFVHM